MANEVLTPDEIREQFGEVVEFPPDGDTEFILTLEPDEDMTARLNAEEEEEESNGNRPDDVARFNLAIDEARKIFMERRESHGSHMDNPEWYDLAGLKVKIWRSLKKLLSNDTPDDDSLLDLACYCLMIVSRRFVKSE